MKIRIEKEVSIASAFTHLIAAWDVGPFPWYRSVEYTNAGSWAIEKDQEPFDDSTVLATVKMDAPDETLQSVTVRIDGRWIERALVKALSNKWADDAALQIINEDPAADQNTADLVMQVGAYGKVVFG